MTTFNFNDLDKFATKIASYLPVDAQHVKNEFRENLRPVLQSLFEKFEIVTQEEFEIQKEILRKTRLKVEELERLIDNIENKP